jgi:hypothetical protein
MALIAVGHFLWGGGIVNGNGFTGFTRNGARHQSTGATSDLMYVLNILITGNPLARVIHSRNLFTCLKDRE